MSFPRYPAYRGSGHEWMERLPAHWDSLTGRRVFRQVRETPVDGDVQLSATQKYGVVPQTLFMELEDQKVVLALSGVANFKRVQEDDFVISLRSFQGGIEHSKYNGCVSPAYTVLRPIIPCRPKYFAYLLKAERYVTALQSVTDGIRDGKNISYEQFGVIGLPIPSLDEQTAIATFLDHETAKIDALVAEQERLIELLKEKRQAVISHAVTKGLDPSVPMKDSGVEWLGEVPAHWAVGGLTRFIGPVIDYRGRTPTKVDEGVFLVTARNIRDGRIDYEASEEYVDPDSAASLLARGAPEIGDVLFTMEAPLGQVALIDRTDIALAQRVVKFRATPNQLRNGYLLYWLMSTGCQSRLETLATGSTALGIKASKLGMIECLAPPLDEQESIVALIQSESSRIDSLVAEAQSAITLFQERRTALISAAVTGQIDVRGIAPQGATA
ncbi:restriction endonuclease subunit S [Ottowia sp.]|uniref:restriction endonuclease subunit S n=1 Tax=Ottowia sp. TaxID=1898956 RepID=UPI00261D149B|nr:restriction endonuclease subunit S [Ottowia sp.]